MLHLTIARLAILSFLLVTLSAVHAVADKPNFHCIKATAVQGSAAENKGWLTNTCTVPVAVVFGFDTKFDGTRKTKPWCIFEGDYGNEHPAGAKGQILGAGERIGVGYYFEPGVRFGVFWAACEIDTSANNGAFILLDAPYVAFDASCGFECQ